MKNITLATLAILVSGVAQAGISDTKHNLGADGLGNTVSKTTEIYVFCHTPHGSETNVAAPLWNKAPTGGGAYTTYADAASSSIDGAILGVGSVSVECLSCHDGVQAMDNIINAPRFWTV